MSFAVIHFNTTTPVGRAIVHLLEKSALADIRDGMELKRQPDGACTLIVHPSLGGHCSKGEESLMCAVESLATSQKVCLSWVLDDIDARSGRALGEAILIAAGVSATTIVGVAS